MVWEEKARYEQSIIPAGHNVLISYLSGMFSKSSKLNESMGGLPYWNYIRDLTQNIENSFEQIKLKLEEIHKKIMCSNNVILSTTGSANLLGKTKYFEELVQSLPRVNTEKIVHNLQISPKSTGLIVPAQVNYVGLGGNLKQCNYEFHGSALVISRFLRMGYLWDRIRVQGGAYGCFTRYSRSSGNFLFASYRDPNVERSLEIYSKAAEYLGNITLSSEDLTKSIIGAMGDIDTYKLPSAKGNAALWEYLTEYTPELKAKTREEVLQTKLSHFHDFAPYLQKVINNSASVALGGQAVQDYAQKQDWEIIKVI